ncbi:MAG: hypothetical protein PVH19_11975 [Planctomycetia bacterium]|jgi:hypothetical protein
MNKKGTPSEFPERDGIEDKKAISAKGDAEAVHDNQMLEFIPKSLQRTYLRAISGKVSPKQAIRAFCLSCVCWDRKEVRLCGDDTCPLYKYRPYVGKGAKE